MEVQRIKQVLKETFMIPAKQNISVQLHRVIAWQYSIVFYNQWLQVGL